MNKYLQGSLILSIYLITTAIGGLTIVKSQWNEYQMFVGICFISGFFFWLITKNAYNFCYNTIKTQPKLSLKFSFYLTFMLLPIYISQKHGVSTLFYNISFAMVLSFLGFLSTKNLRIATIFFISLFLLLIYYKFEIFHVIALVGPFSAFFMLTTSKAIASKTQATTNQIMCLRYVVLSCGAIFTIPFLHFHKNLFSYAEISKLTLVALFINIVPLYCSQYTALLINSNFFAKGAVLLPLVTCIIGALFYSVPFNTIETLFAITLTLPLIYSLVALYSKKINMEPN